VTTQSQPLFDRAEQIADAWQREHPEAPVGSIGILTRIHQAGKLLADERRRALAKVGMDAATLDLLSTLRRSGSPYRLSTRELAARCLVTAGAITQRVDRAAKQGLVRRLGAERGSRLVPVELTAKGHRSIESAVSGLLTYEQSLVDAMDAADQAELARLLEVFLQSLLNRARARHPA